MLLLNTPDFRTNIQLRLYTISLLAVELQKILAATTVSINPET